MLKAQQQLPGKSGVQNLRKKQKTTSLLEVFLYWQKFEAVRLALGGELTKE